MRKAGSGNDGRKEIPMENIKTFDLDRWSEPDEKRQVRHIGMADAKACALPRERPCGRERMPFSGCPGLLRNVPLC